MSKNPVSPPNAIKALNSSPLPTPIRGERGRGLRGSIPGEGGSARPCAGSSAGDCGEKPRNWPCYSCWDLGGDKLMSFHPRASGELIGRELR